MYNNNPVDFERNPSRQSRLNGTNHTKTPIRDFRKLPRRNEPIKLTQYNSRYNEVYSSTNDEDSDDLLNDLLKKQSQRLEPTTGRRYIADAGLLQVEHRPRESLDTEELYLNSKLDRDKSSLSHVDEDSSACPEPDIEGEILRIEFDNRSISSRSTDLSSTKKSKKVSKKTARSPLPPPVSETDTDSLSVFSEKGLDQERFPSYLTNNHRGHKKGTRSTRSDDNYSDKVSYISDDLHNNRNFGNKYNGTNGVYHNGDTSRKLAMETQRRSSNSSHNHHSYHDDEKYSTTHLPIDENIYKSHTGSSNKSERNVERRQRSSRKTYYDKHMQSDPFEKQNRKTLIEMSRKDIYDDVDSIPPESRRSSDHALSVNRVDNAKTRPQRYSLNDAQMRRDEVTNVKSHRQHEKSTRNHQIHHEDVTYPDNHASVENEEPYRTSESKRRSRSSVNSRVSEQLPNIQESESRSREDGRRTSKTSTYSHDSRMSENTSIASGRKTSRSSAHSHRSAQNTHEPGGEGDRKMSTPSVHSRRSTQTASHDQIPNDPPHEIEHRKSRSSRTSVKSNNEIQRKSTSSVILRKSTQEVIQPTDSQPFTNSESGINTQESSSIIASPESPKSTHSRKSSSGRGSHSSKHESRRSSRKNEMGDTDSIGSASSIILRATSRNSKSSGNRSVALIDPDEEILVGDEKDLHDAARSGDGETVEQLLDLGTDINCRNKTDRTPIHWAAGNGHNDVLKIFLERDANIEAADKFGMNALLWAAWFGHPTCVQLLLRAGANATARNKNGFTFLHCAAQNNHVMIEHILTEDLQEFDRDIADDVGRTVLHVLAKHGRKEMLKKFVDLKCDLNIKDKAGNTPLHLAAKNGFSESLPILVEAGANIEEKNLDQKTAMHLAAEEGKSETVEELIKLDADVNAETEDEICPLHLAVSGGHEETVITLINGGADVDAGNKHNQTPLHFAIVANSPSIVQILVMHDSDPNIQDARRETPLHLAAENGYKDVAEILLHSNINLSVTDQRGKTPLDVAARGSYITVVDMILKAQRHQLYLQSPSIIHLDNGHAVERSELDDTPDGSSMDISFEPDNSIETQHIRDLLFKLSNKYLKSDEWRKLAFQWGFTDTQVQAIEEQYTGKNSYREHGYRMLLIWLHGCTMRKENPVRSLFEGLVAIQRKEVAEIMRSKANSLPPDKSCIIS